VRTRRFSHELRQTQVGELDETTGEENQVFGLDVPMVDAPLVQEIDRLGQRLEIAQKLIPRDARQTFLLAFPQAIHQALFAQLPTRDQVAAELPVIEQGDDVGVIMDSLDRFERIQLLLDPGCGPVEGIERDLDGTGTTGAGGPVDLAEGTTADAVPDDDIVLAAKLLTDGGFHGGFLGTPGETWPVGCH
jgi:hypothetical protein